MRPIAQLVEIIGPMLHHANTLVPIFAAGVDPASSIGIEVCQLPFDRIRVPHSHLVEESGGRRAESMSSLSNGVQKGPPIGVEEGPPFRI